MLCKLSFDACWEVRPMGCSGYVVELRFDDKLWLEPVFETSWFDEWVEDGRLEGDSDLSDRWTGDVTVGGSPELK